MRRVTERPRGGSVQVDLPPRLVAVPVVGRRIVSQDLEGCTIAGNWATEVLVRKEMQIVRMPLCTEVDVVLGLS